MAASDGLKSTKPGLGAHSRSFSYEQMQQMGLSRAIDEYHRLLESSDHIKTPRGSSASGNSMLNSILKRTILRPLPPFLTPEFIIACGSALWLIASYIIYLTAPITVPLLLWFAVASSSSTVHVPPMLLNFLPPLQSSFLTTLSFQPPSDLKLRLFMLGIALISLQAAERSVSARRWRKQQSAALTVAPEFLLAYYATAKMAPSASHNGISKAHSSVLVEDEKWQQVVNMVAPLAKAYNGSLVQTQSDAVSWLERVSKDIGITKSSNALEISLRDADAAMRAANEVKAILGA